MTYFRWQVVPAKFRKCILTDGWVTVFCGKIQKGGRRHLGFCRNSNMTVRLFPWRQFQYWAKFCANVCNRDRVVGGKRNSVCRRSLSWTYFRCQFWWHGLFPVTVVCIPAKFCKCISTSGELLRFVGSSKWRSPPSWIIICNTGPTTKSTCGPEFAYQISYWSSYTFHELYFSSYRDLTILQIYTKMPIVYYRPPNSRFGGFNP